MYTPAIVSQWSTPIEVRSRQIRKEKCFGRVIDTCCVETDKPMRDIERLLGSKVIWLAVTAPTSHYICIHQGQLYESNVTIIVDCVVIIDHATEAMIKSYIYYYKSA